MRLAPLHFSRVPRTGPQVQLLPTFKMSKRASYPLSSPSLAPIFKKHKSTHTPTPSPTAGNASTHPAPPGPDASTVKQKIASAEVAARVDADPPIGRLERALKEQHITVGGKEGGECVVHWMRMEDLRLQDNRALSLASSLARKYSLPLIVLFLFSPSDYVAHDRSSRRIDFLLRNLRVLKSSLAALSIPLHTITHDKRKTLPERLMEVICEWRAGFLCANIEYGVDELRRDEKVVRMSGKKGVRCEFLHDKCAVPPGMVKTKEGKPYGVYTPFLKNWTGLIASNPSLIAQSPAPTPNPPTILSHPMFSLLLSQPSEIPSSIQDFECPDGRRMAELWPEGEDAATEVLRRFLRTKVRRSQVGDRSVLEPGVEEDFAKSRVREYADGRNRADGDTSSRLSPYLASGVISIRQCLAQTLALTGATIVSTASRTDGIQMWTQELVWRDFYTHVLCSAPRVSMGRPYLEKFATVKWEVDEEKLQVWKDGKTGFPIVDAAMRQANTQGWMHNRPRMVAASFLVKDLMIDWRLGERYFMQQFIDGDLAANNGGWQWTASTGTDASPYFRIFSPTSQAEKADPTGDYIRHFVPELRNLRGKVLYNPHEHLPTAEFKKLGYPPPIVDHKVSRERALRRYKNPGCD